ncbi:MAG: methylmalonyl Co-A mutase-associated GTPase MeaB [Rubrivivax sp.]
MTARPALHPEAPALPAGLLAGERRAVARAISSLEQGRPDTAGMRVALAAHLGRAHVIGVTGAPGAGKSTLVHAMLGELLARGQRIGVVAVDPSSPLSGGAVLGDRVRMGTHGAHERVFIRSLASRGHLGGLSRSTRAIVDVMDAAGFDTVIVETVGAGQSEVEILRVADTCIVACPPGLGDEVQAIKAGILEIADLLVVTKADRPEAEATQRQLRDMLHLRAAAAPGAWQVAVLATSIGGDGRCEGVAALLDRAAAHVDSCGRGQRLQSVPPRPPAQDDAAARVRRLAEADPLMRLLGLRCTDAGVGRAEVRLTLQPEHLNFNGSCHGGVVFALADTAFGLASNSHGQVAAGIDAHITYQRAAAAGDTLVARALEVSRSKRLAVYRVDVTGRHGQAISSFTGTVYLSGKSHA